MKQASIRLADAALADFERGAIDLSGLVARLKGLVGALEEAGTDADLVSDLRSAWWRFEGVNAAIIDAERDAPLGAEREELEAAREDFSTVLRRIEQQT
jgi:hypothetical protein